MASIGMQYPVWAEVAGESTDGSLVYNSGRVLGRAVNANLNWEIDNSELRGDDATAETENSITGYRLDLTTTELEEGAAVDVLGVDSDQDTTNPEYSDTDDSPPYGGVGYIRVLKRKGTRLYKALWYPKIQFSRNTEADNTKQKNVQWGTPTLNGTGLAMFDNANGKARFRQYKVFTTLTAAKQYLNGKANITA